MRRFQVYFLISDPLSGAAHKVEINFLRYLTLQRRVGLHFKLSPLAGVKGIWIDQNYKGFLMCVSHAALPLVSVSALS